LLVRFLGYFQIDNLRFCPNAVANAPDIRHAVARAVDVRAAVASLAVAGWLGEILTGKSMFLRNLTVILKSMTSAMLPAAFMMMAGCSVMAESKVPPPKTWHVEPKQSELWGLPELSHEAFDRIKVGDSSISGETLPKQGTKCFIVWIGKRSYHACILVSKAMAQDKSLREVRLTY
jgi:hypothetical protein